MTNHDGPGSPPARPAVAVSMPARNAAAWIGEAIESVLSQEGVDVELVVVDDGSTDGTAAVAERYRPRGARVLRFDERRGIGAGHNRVLAETSSPVVAHVDADDVIAPGALAKLAAALDGDERIGQAYCDFYPIGADGGVDEAVRAEWGRFFERHRAPPIDYARELVVHGMVAGALRTYRRSALEEVGGFDERLAWAVDYEMALRIAERFDFVRVPEMLYGRRLHAGGASQGPRSGALVRWWARQRIVRDRLRAGGGRLMGHGRFVTAARLLRGSWPALRALSRPPGDAP